MIDPQLLKWQIEAMACVARIEGMKAANNARDTPSEAVTYSEGHFSEEAEQLELIAEDIRNYMNS
jgi:hypothetical protein